MIRHKSGEYPAVTSLFFEDPRLSDPESWLMPDQPARPAWSVEPILPRPPPEPAPVAPNPTLRPTEVYGWGRRVGLAIAPGFVTFVLTWALCWLRNRFWILR